MTGIYDWFFQAISAPTGNATSSPASAVGPTPFNWLDTTVPYGPAAVPASRSAPPARTTGLPTSGTSGRSGSISSASASLQSSLVSRLQASRGFPGSILFALTWKERATPSGRPICALRASGHRTSGSGYGSWQSPNVVDGKGRGYTYSQGKHDKPFLTLVGQARLSSWPSPDGGAHNVGADLGRHMARMERLRKKWNNGNGAGLTLGIVAQLASWPTPMAGTPAQKGYNEAGNNDSSRKTVALVSWPTPTLYDAERGGQAKRAMGVTRHGSNLQDFALLGARLNGSRASTEKRGQLNPAFSLWLMGYPPEWLNCAPSAMPSSRKSRLNLSKIAIDTCK